MLFATREAPGVQSIEGELKRFLLEGTGAIDIDQVNAIPTPMVQDARGHGKTLPELESYVAHRAHWLVQISCAAACTQKQAKTLVLSILFGGKYQTWLRKGGLGGRDTSEAIFGKIAALQAGIRHYVAWWDGAHGGRVREHDLRTNKQLRAKGTNPAFRRISLFYQDLETKVTLVVKGALERRGVTTHALCHDGLIAKGVDSLDEASVRSLLRLCTEAVKRELGYDVGLEVKSLEPTSGLSFEQYVRRKWPSAEAIPVAPAYDKALGQSQDRAFAEHLIAAKSGQFFLRRHDGCREQYGFWCLAPEASCWVEGWPTLCK
jgi:hypothetical protein